MFSVSFHSFSLHRYPRSLKPHIILSMSWLPLESNPDVLTSYLHKLGVPESVSCTDVLGLDDDVSFFFFTQSQQ